MSSRREFITLLGGSAIALAFSPAAPAQGRQAPHRIAHAGVSAGRILGRVP